MGAEPVIAWTSAESPLFVELASRALRARVDGGPALRSGESAHFRVEAHHGAEQAHLELLFVGARAELWLEPEVVSGHAWRAGWTLEVHGEGATHELRAGEAPVELHLLRDHSRAEEGPHRVSLRATLATARLALARRLMGTLEPVPLWDLSFHRYTRQSSADASSERATPPPWSRRSEAEVAPWWEIDLAPPAGHYLAALSVRVACSAPGLLRVRAYGLHTLEGAPPEGSLLHELAIDEASADVHIALRLDAEQRGVVARYVRVELRASDEPATLQVLSTQILGVPLFAPTLRASVERAYQIFAARPLVYEREGSAYVPTLSYAEAWENARSLGAAIAARLSPQPTGERITAALATRGRAEWIIAELCALLRGDVSVPLSPDEPDERVRAILERTRPAWILVEPPDLARFKTLAPDALVIVCGENADGAPSFEGLLEEGRTLPALVHASPEEESLHAVLFTSGSGAEPKGAMRTYAGFRTVIESYALAASPRHLSFQPLSHLSERMFLPAVIMHGGCVAFSRGPAHLLEELRAFEPTGVGSVPRLFEALRARYTRRLRALAQASPERTRAELEATALAEARATLGSRLWAIAIGSAPVSAELLAFVRRVFSDVWVSEGYGTTELGTIAVDGRVVRGVEVELRSVDGGRVQAQRGEIWVRSPHVVAGYLGADGASFTRDARGFVATGDLGERDALGRLQVVGRVRNAIKLGNGEFVSLDRVEAALATTPLVERVFVHAEGGAAGVVALVVPERAALAEALERDADADLEALCADPSASALVLGALRRHTRQTLAAHELPIAAVLHGEPLRVEDGVLTASGKWVRARMLERHGERLRALLSSAASAEPSRGAPAQDDASAAGDVADVLDGDLLTRVLSISAQVLGRRVSARDSLRDLGVESLVAAELLAALSEELGRPLPPAWLLESADLAALSDRLAQFAPQGRVGGTDLVDSDLQLALDAAPARTTEPGRGHGHVLLTGATGFLGGHLLEAFLAAGVRVSALVRAGDDARALARLRAASTRWGTTLGADAPVRAVAADLSVEGLGLTPQSRAQLLDADQGIDCVVHAGAHVSWLMDYASLRAPNVLGTRALLELAARRGATFHHVSTISTAPAWGDEETTLSLTQIRAASTPYALSKWVAEELARRARSVGLAVEIHRPAMIAAHSTRGTCNPDDYVHRYIAGVLELGLYLDDEHAKLDMTPVDYVASAIRALVLQHPRSAQDETHHYANVDASLCYAALGRALCAVGVCARPASHSEFMAALRAQPSSRLAPLAAFMATPASLAMGPWPCARTDARVAALGVTKPAIDASYVSRLVSHVRAAIRAPGA